MTLQARAKGRLLPVGVAAASPLRAEAREERGRGGGGRRSDWTRQEKPSERVEGGEATSGMTAGRAGGPGGPCPPGGGVTGAAPPSPEMRLDPPPLAAPRALGAR